MLKNSILLGLMFIMGISLNAQVAVNTGGSQPDASSMLDVQSTTKGFLPPRMNSTQRDAISSPAEGLLIYNTEDNSLQFFQNPLWFDLSTQSVLLGPPDDCPAPDLASDETQVVDVYNPATSDTWMDRNLGAFTVARQSDDCWAYGNLYQWGRASDGHEFRTSSSTSTNATTAVPNLGNSWDGMFIIENNYPFDWLALEDNTLWQGAGGTNNPCPAGYRLPTETEQDNELASWGQIKTVLELMLHHLNCLLLATAGTAVVRSAMLVPLAAIGQVPRVLPACRVALPFLAAVPTRGESPTGGTAFQCDALRISVGVGR